VLPLSVISANKAKATMLRVELITTCTAGIDIAHSTRFTILTLLVSRSQTQRYLYAGKAIWFEWWNSPIRASFCCCRRKRHYQV